MTHYAEVIGDPVAHSKSPLIHRFWLGRLGIAGDYRATRVERGGVGDYLEARADDPNWRGCNVTMPHKRDALAFVPGPSHGGHPLAVNLIWRSDSGLKGQNTDILGIAEALDGAQIADIVIVGAGAAAGTAILALLDRQQRITLVARNPAKARAELGELARLVRIIGWDEAWPPTRLLINASPLGMTGFDAFPFDLDPLADGATVFDMVYSPLETGLLAAARARGLACVDGLRMLVGQARASFAAFFGETPSRAHDEALRRLLTQ